MVSKIIFEKPTEITWDGMRMEIKISLDNQLIYHHYAFARGDNKKVDAVVDYLLKALNYKIYIFSFPLKKGDATFEWKY